MFVPEYRFVLIEHDLDRPWIVLDQQHRTVTLDDGVSFFKWAQQAWPEPTYTVQLNPYQLGRAATGR